MNGTWMTVVCALARAAAFAGEADPARYADPFIGTAGTAHCFPNATRPHGLVQPGPASGTGDWRYCGGYQFGDRRLRGFVQDAISGTGVPDLGDILLQPFTGGGEDAEMTAEKGAETASPGFYSVRYPRQGILTEATATPRVAFYRIDFGGAADAHLLVDLQWGAVSAAPGELSTHVLACRTDFAGDTALTGSLSLKRWVTRDCHFELSFNRPFTARRLLPARDPREKGERWVLDFDGAAPLLVKVALSAASVAAARANRAAELPHWDFDRVVAEARADWNRLFARVEVDGTDAQKTAFYTSLYHLTIAPNDISDCGETPFYSTLSFWDTFRAAHPLFTLLEPERVPGMVASCFRYYKENGFLPVWALWGKDNQCMIGTHSIPVIVDWFLKSGGSRSCATAAVPIDWHAAYAAIKDTLTQAHPNRRKERWDLVDKYGYYPIDDIKGESVARLLECAYDDWCAGVMAERLGHADDAAFFYRRSGNWRNVLDPSLGLVRGRDRAGRWREPFDPFSLGHGAESANDFTEGNSFQYTWHVMQDPVGFIAALGGQDAFVKKLDSLFVQPERTAGSGVVLDVTGLIGQYAHGNEPSHHIAYFYPFADRPDRTADIVREVCDRFYLNTPDGLSGNDDCGQMSAWYVFSAMGFYPFNPCGGDYVLGAPQVPKIVIHLGGARSCATVDAINCVPPGEGCGRDKRVPPGEGCGRDKRVPPGEGCGRDKRVPPGEGCGRDKRVPPRTFTVIANNLSRENKYVKSIRLNGRPLAGILLRHDDILRGGELVFEMAARPD